MPNSEMDLTARSIPTSTTIELPFALLVNPRVHEILGR